MTRVSRRVHRIIEEPRERFGLLLVLMIVSFLVSGIDAGGGVRGLVGIVNVLAAVVGFTSVGLRANAKMVVAIVAVGAVSSVLVSSFRGDIETSVGAWLQALVLVALTLAVLGRVIQHQRVTGETILGAIAAYFLIGQVFAWIYMALPGYADGEVLANSTADELPMYYSYVVLSTLGFGDVIPIGSLAERVTVIEALLGQIFLATFVARLVSVYSRERVVD